MFPFCNDIEMRRALLQRDQLLLQQQLRRSNGKTPRDEEAGGIEKSFGKKSRTGHGMDQQNLNELSRRANTTHAQLMSLCRNDLLQNTRATVLPLSMQLTKPLQQSCLMPNNPPMGGYHMMNDSFSPAASRLTATQILGRDFLDLHQIQQAARNISTPDPALLMANNSAFHATLQNHLGSNTFNPARNFMKSFDQPNMSQPERTTPIPQVLPACLARPMDKMKLSEHQHLLRFQIEAFEATEEDVSTHTRGRNKPIVLGQVGIRCRHCAHIPVSRRQKGSTYFPASTLGIYQAAQNMSTAHIQCGLCTEMPEQLKEQFKHSISIKSSYNGAGRPYWAQSAKEMGLVDTEDGIRFVRDAQPPQGIVTKST